MSRENTLHLGKCSPVALLFLQTKEVSQPHDLAQAGSLAPTLSTVTHRATLQTLHWNGVFLPHSLHFFLPTVAFREASSQVAMATSV